jgi:hypothetical protein
MEDLTTLSLERINELMDEAGITNEISSAEFTQVNASNEAQYTLTYYSPIFKQEVTNHAFVDIDLQGDTRIRMKELEEGELNLRSDMPVEEN